MSRRRRKHQGHSIQQQREILASPVNLKGTGEDAVIQALVSKMRTATNEEGLEIALGLQKLIRGDASYLDDPKFAGLVAGLRGEFAAMDKTAKKFDEDQDRFIEDQFTRSELIKETGSKAERIKAKVGQEYRDALIVGRANQQSKKMYLDHLAKTDVRVDVYATGEIISTNYGPRVVPEEIRIMHQLWLLRPGKNRIPQYVADRYFAIKESQRILMRRKEILSVQQDGTVGEWRRGGLPGQQQLDWRALDKEGGDPTTGSVWSGS